MQKSVWADFWLNLTQQSRNKQFLDSRKEDPAIKDRADALQSLDLAYFKYKEITRNLEEGFKASFTAHQTRLHPGTDWTHPAVLQRSGGNFNAI